MSLSLIAFHPAMDDPSNMKPSVKLSSSTTPEAIVRCCHLPLGSVKRRSTQSISSSLIRDRIVPALVPLVMLPSLSPPEQLTRARRLAGLESRDSSLGVQIADRRAPVSRAANISLAQAAATGRLRPSVPRGTSFHVQAFARKGPRPIRGRAMSASGLEVFDRTLETTHIWLNEICNDLGPDKQVAWKVLSTVLHKLRDRLTMN